MSANHHGNPSDCENILELIPDYAFGLTDSEETRLVESRLASCPDAATQLEDFNRLKAEMLTAVPQIDPPPALEARLMAAIATPIHAAKPRRFRFQRAWIAAAIAAILLISTNLYWIARTKDLTTKNNQLIAQANGTTNSAFILTSTSSLRWVRLPPSEQNVDTSAFLMWNAESKIGLLYAHGFPKLAVGTTYQLWLTRGTTRVSGGTFRVDDDGKGALLFQITEPIDDYTWARITAEPENGSASPSDKVVVVGQLL